MGMYTELHFNSQLEESVPNGVVLVLEYMLDSSLSEPSLPSHPLFETDRWRYMFRMDSYYFDADTHSTLRYDDIASAYFLCVRCNLKNYSGEISKFLDWIMPYLHQIDNAFLGFYRYEEDENPTLIYYREKE